MTEPTQVSTSEVIGSEISTQTEQALLNLAAVRAAAGSDLPGTVEIDVPATR